MSIDKVELAVVGLSNHQRNILLWLLRWVETLENRKDQVGLEMLEEGIPWAPKIKNTAARESDARALTRLEKRELVNRIAPNGRTSRLRLTILGRLAALKLRDTE